MANAGCLRLPVSWAEFMVIMGAVKVNFWVGAFGPETLIYGASHTLWMYKRAIFGAIHNPHVAEMKDINCREFAILAIFGGCCFWAGSVSASVYRSGASSGNDLIAHVAQNRFEV